jgi:Tol biopolymer transport system component
MESFPTGAPHTQDGKILYLASIRPGGRGLADIYVSAPESGGWKNLTNLGPRINTPAMESEPYISPDHKELYFASTREGGKGKVDIWMAAKAHDDWGDPVNLGGPVNTEYEETQPFVTPDGKNLYFTAVNRQGVPGPAIFRSTKVGDRWGAVRLVVSGFVGEPTLTSDQKTLYFVHLLQKNGQLVDAEIMLTRRKRR